MSELTSSFFFLPPIIILGIITTITDVRHRKIYNKTILSFILYAALFYCFQIALSGSSAALYFKFDKWVINLFISSLVTYVFWKKDIWGAGDAKLFICYAALIPLCKYSKVYFDYNFASFYLLLAVFIPSTIYLFFDLLRKEIKSFSFTPSSFVFNIRKAFDDARLRIKPRRLLRLITTFFVYFLFFKFTKIIFSLLLLKLPGMKFHIHDMHMVLLLFVFKRLFSFFIKNRPFIMYMCIIFAVFVIIGRRVDLAQFYGSILNSFKNAVFISLFWPLLSRIIDVYRVDYFEKTVPFAFWMFLGALIVWFS